MSISEDYNKDKNEYGNNVNDTSHHKENFNNLTYSHSSNDNFYNFEEFVPVHKNEKLFKMILNSTKIELKLNSFISLVYISSNTEIILWLISLILFIFSPESFFLAWLLAIHIGRAIVGLVTINAIPKTYEIIERISNCQNFEESKINSIIYEEIKKSLSTDWENNKKLLLTYFIMTISASLIDFGIFIAHVVMHSNHDQIAYNSIMIIISFILLCKDLLLI